MSRPTIPSALAAGVLACGCGGDQTESVPSLETTREDSAGVEIVHIQGPLDGLPIWTLDPEPLLEVRGDREPFLGAIGEVGFLSGGRVVVEDNQTDQLHLFGPGGEALRVIGRQGEGPGEFESVTELTVSGGDTIVTYDRRLYRVSRFDPEGDFVDALTVDRERDGAGSLVLDAWPVQPGRLLLHSLGRELTPWVDELHRDVRSSVLESVDLQGDPLVEPLRSEGDYSIRGAFGDAGSPFANDVSVSVHDGQVLHGSGVEYDLMVRDADLRLIRAIRWEGWGVPLTPDVVDEVRSEFEESYAEFRESRPDLVEDLMEALFAPDLLPDTLPAVSRATFDEQGRIWVLAFAPSSNRWDETDRWHVLDPTGVPLARVELPARTRAVAFGADRLALVRRDSLDVEHLGVLRLDSGSGGP